MVCILKHLAAAILVAFYNNKCKNTDCIIKITILSKFVVSYSHLGPRKIYQNLLLYCKNIIPLKRS